MYIDKTDYLVGKNRKEYSTDKMIHGLLKKCFPEFNVMPVCGSYLNSDLIFLSYLSHFVSVPMINMMYGPIFSNAKISSQVKRSKDRGDLIPIPFSSTDMGARNGFYVSSACMDDLLSNISGTYEKNKIRRNGGVIATHDYGIGLSLLQCTLLEKPIKFAKEIPFSFHSYKSKGSVCTDLHIRFMDSGNAFYIEQDMGTEPIYTLVKKLSDYYRLELLKDKTALFISSHAIYNDASCPAFSVSHLSKLYNAMLESTISDLRSAYSYLQVQLEPNTKLTLECLCVLVGIAKGYDMDHNYVYAANYQEGCSIEFISSAPAFTISDLERFIGELKAGQNLYRIREYNRYQERIAKNKFQGICHFILSRMNEGYYELEEVIPMLKGYPFYVIPTTLLSDALDEYLSIDKDSLYRYLKSHYSSLQQSSYLEESYLFANDGYPGIALQNTYLTSDGTLVCVLDIGRDVSGFLRMAYFINAISLSLFEDQETRVHLVGYFHTMAELRYFCKESAYYSVFHNFYTSIPDIPFFVSFTNGFTTDCPLLGMSEGSAYTISKGSAPADEVVDLSSLLY